MLYIYIYIYIIDPERDLALEPATCIASSAINSCLAKSQLIAHSAGQSRQVGALVRYSASCDRPIQLASSN